MPSGRPRIRATIKQEYKLSDDCTLKLFYFGEPVQEDMETLVGYLETFKKSLKSGQEAKRRREDQLVEVNEN